MKSPPTLVFLATTLLVAQTDHSSLAFTINYPPAEMQAVYEQDAYGYTWTAFPEVIQQTDITGLLNLLNNFGNSRRLQSGNSIDWQFDIAPNDLEGSFDIKSYQACRPELPCGMFTGSNFLGGVGGSIELEYNPVGNDPIPPSVMSEMFWIQRVISNHPIVGSHGQYEDIIDVSITNTIDPYYSTLRRDQRYFIDTSYRYDAWEDHNWTAELYLAKETESYPGGGIRQWKVTIYNGIKWGWRNRTFRRYCPISVAGFNCESIGQAQYNPILASANDEDWKIFSNVLSGLWFDPPTNEGFEFQTTGDTLFTNILDFPIGLDADNLFTVSVGDTKIGEFSPGQNVDFVSLLGGGVKSFNITGIDSIFGSTQETAFPIQLAFNKNTGSFKMRPISQPKSVPEPHSLFGLFTLLLWAGFQGLKITKSK